MGLDSVELVMAWEDAFGLRFSRAEARGLSTVGDVVEFVAEKLRAEGRPRARNEVFEVVCAITVEQCGAPRAMLTVTTRFGEDLGVD
jgi:acyl carrier protein